MSPFSTLPDVCLIKIFTNLSLTDLLHLKFVCSNWGNSITAVCNQIKSLRIIVGRNACQLVGTSPFPIESTSKRGLAKELTVLELDPVTLTLLSSQLHNISSLEVYQNLLSTFEIDQTTFLISHYSPTLTYLNLNIRKTSEQYRRLESETFHFNIARLFARVNHLQCLTHLTLTFHNRINTINLSLLSRLIVFRFWSPDNAAILFTSLAQLTGQSNLQQLEIRNDIYTYNCLEKYSQLRPEITSKLTHLSLTYQIAYDDIPLKLQLDSLTSLSSLKLNANFITLHQLVHFLYKLPSLVHLELVLDFSRRSALEITPELVRQLPALWSIKTLTLNIWTASEDDLLHFPAIFPSLQKLEMVDQRNHEMERSDRLSYLQTYCGNFWHLANLKAIDVFAPPMRSQLNQLARGEKFTTWLVGDL